MNENGDEEIRRRFDGFFVLTNSFSKNLTMVKFFGFP